MKSLFLLLFIFTTSFATLFLHEARAEEDETLEQSLIDDNVSISKFFESTANGLDLFLAGKQKGSRRNNTHVLLENSTYLINGQDPLNQTNINVKLNLPNLEEYWQLKFSNYDEEQEKRNVQQGLGQAPKSQGYGAGVGFFHKLGDVRFSFQPLVELRDPLQISHTLTFESVVDMKTYQLNPELQFFATADKGVGTFFAMNLNKPLSKKYNFTLINNAEYDEKQPILLVTNGFSIGYSINKEMGLSYNLIFSSNNDDNYHLQTYTASVAFSHVIYYKILDYQIIPHLDFDKSTDYTGNPGITFNITLTF